jgi:hypothetical protein
MTMFVVVAMPTWGVPRLGIWSGLKRMEAILQDEAAARLAADHMNAHDAEQAH